MATNAEQIQLDLAKVNNTMWEPEPLSKIQLNGCLLGCMSLTITAKIASITEVITALNDIEDVATGDTGINDVVFEKVAVTPAATWSITSHANGTVMFGANTASEFYTTYIIPNVSTATVPIEEDLGDGNGLVPRAAASILRDRIAVLADPMEVLEATINGLTAFQVIIDAKKVALEAVYV